MSSTTKWHLIYADTENKLLSRSSPLAVYSNAISSIRWLGLFVVKYKEKYLTTYE